MESSIACIVVACCARIDFDFVVGIEVQCVDQTVLRILLVVGLEKLVFCVASQLYVRIFLLRIGGGNELVGFRCIDVYGGNRVEVFQFAQVVRAVGFRRLVGVVAGIVIVGIAVIGIAGVPVIVVAVAGVA